MFDDVPSSTVAAAALAGEGVAVVELLASQRVDRLEGRSDASDSQVGGVYVNNRRVTDERARCARPTRIGGRLFVFGRTADSKIHLRAE